MISNAFLELKLNFINFQAKHLNIFNKIQLSNSNYNILFEILVWDEVTLILTKLKNT